MGLSPLGIALVVGAVVLVIIVVVVVVIVKVKGKTGEEDIRE